MKKLFVIPLATLAWLTFLAAPAVATDTAPETLDLAFLSTTGACAANQTPALAARDALREAPEFFRAACVYSKSCGSWRVTGCCSAPIRQERKRTCEERCCIGSQCLTSGPVTETECVQGPC